MLWPSPELAEKEFKNRYLEQFVDPQFKTVAVELAAITQIASIAYEEGRKSPRTRKAGANYSNPDYDLSVDWIAAHEAIGKAKSVIAIKQRHHEFC